VGAELVVTIRRPCEPCGFLAGLPYVGPSRFAAFERAVRGRRGWYARVDRPGRIRRGDAVRLIEPGSGATGGSGLGQAMPER